MPPNEPGMLGVAHGPVGRPDNQRGRYVGWGLVGGEMGIEGGSTGVGTAFEEERRECGLRPWAPVD